MVLTIINDNNNSSNKSDNNNGINNTNDYYNNTNDTNNDNDNNNHTHYLRGANFRRDRGKSANFSTRGASIVWTLHVRIYTSNDFPIPMSSVVLRFKCLFEL